MNTNTVPTRVRAWSGHRNSAVWRSALLLAASAITGCVDDDDDDYFDDDAAAAAAVGDTYPLDADYASDAAYAGVDGDDWGSAFYSNGTGAGSADAGTATTARDPISAIRALAQGSTDVCPGQVQATPMTANSTCGNDGTPGDVPSGVSLDFQGCQLQGGGTLNGTVTLSRSETPSNTACDASTTLTINYQVTISNLTYQATDGKQTVMKSLTATGTYNRSLDKPPSTITTQLNANIVRSGADGNVISDRTLSGDSTFTLSGSAPNITVIANSSLNVTSANSGGQGTLSMDSLKKEPSCCHPTGGTVTVSGPETGTFQFGPSCGDATKNGTAFSLDECT